MQYILLDILMIHYRLKVYKAEIGEFGFSFECTRTVTSDCGKCTKKSEELIRRVSDTLTPHYARILGDSHAEDSCDFAILYF